MPTLKELRAWARGKGVDGLPEREVMGPANQRELPGRARMLERLDALKNQARTAGSQQTGMYKISKDGDDALVKFGKHAGKTLTAIMDEDPTYLAWMLREDEDGQPRFDAVLLDVVRYVQEDHWKKARDERARRRRR